MNISFVMTFPVSDVIIKKQYPSGRRNVGVARPKFRQKGSIGMLEIIVGETLGNLAAAALIYGAGRLWAHLRRLLKDED